MEVLLESSVLVSILGSLLIAMLSRRLTRLGEYLLTHISLAPRKVRGRLRIAKWRNKKNLLLKARSPHQVTWAILRTYSYLIFFVLIIALYLLLVTLGPLKGIGSLPWQLQAFIASPIYIFEILWLLQKEKTLTLVRIAEQRVTSQSTSRLRQRIA